MFMGPLVDTKPWATRGVEGVHRFLNRVWRMIVAEDGSLHASIQDAPLDAEHEKLLHQTIRKVSADIDNLDFNTAISQMMIFVNEFLSLETKSRKAMESFVLLLSPFAPHLAEELWLKLGHTLTLAYAPWPEYDETKDRKTMTEIVVQVNGKVRSKFSVAIDSPEAELERIAKQDPAVVRHIEGKTIRKVHVVKNKLVSIVAS
jgi:leucyl-tRNA synthetase